MAELEYVVRINLDRCGQPTSGSVVSYVDEREQYRVSLLIGPFETLDDVLRACHEGLDKHESLW